MNTPKTFEPVVTDEMRDAFYRLGETSWSFSNAVLAASAHPDFQRQLRAYATEVARAMVPDEVSDFAVSEDAKKRVAAHNACRAATLSAIDEWEKNDANR